MTLVETLSLAYLTRHSMGTEFAEAQGWRYLSQQGHHVDMFDFTLKIV